MPNDTGQMQKDGDEQAQEVHHDAEWMHMDMMNFTSSK